MEPVIWVEVLARNDEVVARTRCVGTFITIGRGYDNDVIIDDPHVAPHHLRIERDAVGGLTAIDLGTKGGFFLGGRGRRQNRAHIDGTQPLTIGDTHLRIRPSDFPVPPELAIMDGKVGWLQIGVLLGVLFAYVALGSWLEDTKPFKFIHYGGFVFSITLLLAIWVGGWSLLSRIFAGSAKFLRHLRIAVILTFATSFLSLATGYISFETAAPVIEKYAYIADWSIIGFFCFLHMRVMGPTRLKFKAAIAGALALLAVGAHTMFMFGMEQNQSQYDYSAQLKPALLRLASPEPEQAFWIGVEELKPKLDKARKTPPSGD